MKKLFFSLLLLSIGGAAGFFGHPFIQQELGKVKNKAAEPAEPKILYWVAPMDANYRRDKPGKSPMGMDLVPVYEEQKPVKKEPKILYWVAPMDANYRRDKPGKSPMGMDLVPVYEEDGGTEEEGVVKISPMVENNLGVRTAKVEKGMLNLQIDTVGYVSFDEDKLYHLHTRTEGWIEKLAVKSTGDPVKKGQKLFELYSPLLVSAQEEYLTALKSGNALLIKASKERLLSLDVPAGQIAQLAKTRKVAQRVVFYAKNDGFVERMNVREGMFIKPSTNVLSVGQLDTVWVIAEVFERQSGWVMLDKPAELRVVAYPNKVWHGKVDYIYPILDEKNRTLRVRLRFENKGHLLKPNMFGQLNIHGTHKHDALFVKREAIIRNGSMQRVVKSLGDGRFKSVAVSTGIENGEVIEITSGLEENDNIVTSAQFLIDSESSLSASFERMEPVSGGAGEAKMGMDRAEQKKETKQTWVNGKITQVMAGHKMLTIAHEPVDDWGWPSMEMDFPVSKTIDFEPLQTAQPIRFLVEKHDDGSIEIIELEQGAKP